MPNRMLAAVLGARLPLRFPSATRLIHLFFFASGMPALAYQLIWQRVLFRIFGVNMESVTIVVTAFMLGLGIGSLIGSWLAARRSIAPLILIACIELLIGIFGLFSIGLFDVADHFVQDLSLADKSAAAIALVFVPTALMGMTLPLLVGYLVSRSANVGLSTGSLYRANTLGGVMGCVGCALILFPLLGLQGSVRVAAGLNAAIAVGALLAFLLGDREKSGIEEPKRTSRVATSIGLLSRPKALVLAFLGGFVSLSYEIFLFRLASFASGTSPVLLALILAAFLLGVAFGAQFAAEWCAGGDPAAASQRAVKLLLANGLSGLLILPLLAISAPLGNGMLGLIALTAFFVACSLGVLLPLVAHLAVAPDGKSGSRIGLLYLANILGSATGSLLTGFVLADFLSSPELAILLSLLVLATAMIFHRVSARETRKLKLPLAAVLAGFALLVAFEIPLSARVWDSMLYKTQASRNPTLARVVENRDGVIAVSRDGIVFGGGVYDGRFNTSLVHDTNGIVRAFGLSLYHPHPSDVLMIGLASGSWGQVIANNPDVVHFTIVEINPGYIQLIRERPEVASLLKNPRVEIVIDDGRRWLKRQTSRRFDAIVANTTYHFRSNASNVLSTEFDGLIRAHLKRGGVYLFNTTDSARVQRTGCGSFRYGYRIFNNVLVSDAPIAMNLERWKQRLLNYRIDGRQVIELLRPGDAAALHTVLRLMDASRSEAISAGQAPVESCARVMARTTGKLPVTDDNMGTEWRYPLGLE